MMEVDNCVDPVNGLKLAGNHSNRRVSYILDSTA